MEQPAAIGIDLAKNVFQGPSGNDRSSGSIVAKDAWARAGRALLRRTLRRAQMLESFGRLRPA